MRSLMLAILLFTACVAGATRAGADGMDARVQAMLGTYEAMPAREEWLRLGSEVVPILIAVSEDADAPTFRRARALTVLGHFATADARARLTAVASSDQSPSLRRTALLALAKGDPDAAMPMIREALRSSDPLLRQTAAKALGTVRTPEATRQLQDLLVSEKTSAVRDQAQYELEVRRQGGP